MLDKKKYYFLPVTWQVRREILLHVESNKKKKTLVTLLKQIEKLIFPSYFFYFLSTYLHLKQSMD